MSDADTDPFTLGYRAILAALRGSAIFNATVLLGNQVDQTDPAYVQAKPTVQPGDLPEVELLQTTYGLQPQAINSRAVGWAQDYPLVITGDAPGPADVNRVKWACFCALSRAGDDMGTNFVRGWEIVAPATDKPALADPEKERGVKRYVSAFAVRLHCYANRTKLPQ